MREKILGQLAEIIQRPQGLSDIEKKQLLDEIDQTGNSKVWGDAFRAYWKLGEQINSGVIRSFSDIPSLKLFHIIFEQAFHTDADTFLNRWRYAQDRKRFTKEN